MRRSRTFFAVGLTCVFCLASFHCTPGDCIRYSDCSQGYTCAGGKCTVPSSDAATASGADGGDSANVIDGAAPLACPPASTANYQPPTYAVATGHQGLCTTEGIAAFVAECADPSDSGTSCANWQNTNVAGDGGSGTACGNCIFAPENNGAVWVDPGGLISPNYAGCIQLIDALNGTACAMAYNNYGACNGVACDYCPNPNAPSDVTGVNDLEACTSAALLGGCNTFNAQLDACNSDFEDGGALFTCSPSAGQAQDWTYIATQICGGTSAEAGADASAE